MIIINIIILLASSCNFQKKEYIGDDQSNRHLEADQQRMGQYFVNMVTNL